MIGDGFLATTIRSGPLQAFQVFNKPDKIIALTEYWDATAALFYTVTILIMLSALHGSLLSRKAWQARTNPRP